MVAQTIGKPNSTAIFSVSDGCQVFWLLGPYIMFTLAFGGVMVPKLNL